MFELFWKKISYKIGCNLRLKLHLKKIIITIYYKNLTVELHVLYTFNKYVKFCVNKILFII